MKEKLLEQGRCLGFLAHKHTHCPLHKRRGAHWSWPPFSQFSKLQMHRKCSWGPLSSTCPTQDGSPSSHYAAGLVGGI